MSEEENAVINENQDNKAHSLTNFIVFYFKNVDFKNDNDIKKIKSK